MKTIADYTSPRLMIPCLHSQDAAAVVGELCGVLRREGRLKDLLPFFNAAMNAEYLDSSATFPGWAVPQARVKDVSDVSFALGRSGPPLEWLGRSGQLVRLVFLFAVPETDPTTYLALGSALNRLGLDPVLLEGLLLAPDGQAMFDILKRVPLRQPHGAAAGVPSASMECG
ncbi:MAG: PTS sugar transporter subunit IIA [Limisphaerales bacterium]